MAEFASKIPDKHNHSETIKTVSCFDDARNRINNEAKWFYERNKNNPEKVQDLRTFLLFQEEDRNILDKKYNTKRIEIKKETQTEKAKLYMYKKIWISEHLQANDWWNKYKKWFIDWTASWLELFEDYINLKPDDVLEYLSDLDIKESIKNWYDKLVSLNREDLIKNMKQAWNETDWIYTIWMIVSWIWIIWKWKEIISWTKNLYEIPEYKFLEKHKDILWENLEWKYYINEWQNAVILHSMENPDFVLKIRKPDKNWLEKEFKNHKKIFNAYYELTDWLTNTDKYPNIRIPRISKMKGFDDKLTNEIFLIEKIDWESILDKTMTELLSLDKNANKRKILDELEKNDYSTYMKVVIEAKKRTMERLWIWPFDWYNWFWWHHIRNIISKDIDTPIINLFRDIYKNYWYLHNDFHPWNIIVDWDDGIIIDFWNILEHKK